MRRRIWIGWEEVGEEGAVAAVVVLQAATELGATVGSRAMATVEGMEEGKGVMGEAREATEGAMATAEVTPAMVVATAVNRQAATEEVATVATLRAALEAGMVASSKEGMVVEATVGDQ